MRVVFLLIAILILLHETSAITLFPGRTSAAPGWKRIGNHSFDVVPLLATGNQIPLLTGTHGSFYPHPSLQFTVFGSMDGTGIEKVVQNDGVTYYYVYLNHEYSAWHQTSLPGSSTVYYGARMSLFVFTQDFQIVGGKDLVETKKSAISGAVIDHTFGGLCAACFVESGFIGGPFFISSEEGDGGYSSWAVSVKDGVAIRLEGCGALHHENTVVASNYLPSKGHPSKKTVFMTTDDSSSGEVFMFVGDQTVADPNGFSAGTLYVLRVEDLDYESMTIGSSYAVSWTPVPWDIASQTGKDGYNALDAWVNQGNRSTNFRKIEDINEDPNNPGTFYFAATGGPFPVNSSLTLNYTQCGTRSLIDGGCDNPFGKLYRLKINNIDPAGTGTLELMLEGSFDNGGGFDNVCVTRSGDVLILEDATPTALSEIYIPKGRYAQILKFNVGSGQVEPIFEVDFATLEPNAAPYSRHMSHSGIVEFGDASNPMFMIALQGPAFDVPGDAQSGQVDAGLKIFSGQLAILTNRPVESVTTSNQLVSWGAVQPTNVVVVQPSSSTDNTGLIVALVVGWVVAGLCGLVIIFLLVSKPAVSKV